MKFDLVDYVQSHGGVPGKKGEWTLQCPVCGKADKLVVNVDKGAWHCWVCEDYRVGIDGKRVPVKGAGGLKALVQLLEGCSEQQAAAIVASGRSFGYTGSLTPLSELIGQTELPTAHIEIPPPPGWKPIVGNLPYCEQRGITSQDVVQFGLVYCDSGRYRNRLIFPVWSEGKLLYYQARAMWTPVPGEHFVKALNPLSVPGALGPTEVLMNLDTAKYHPRVAITEGPIDCIHAGSSAVCTFGKKISDAQILLLVKAGVKAVDLLWDGPTPSEPQGAWPEMLQAANRLAAFFDTKLVFLPYGDPGDYTREELDRFREVAARSAASISRLALI